MVQENHMQVHFDAKSVNEGLARMVVTLICLLESDVDTYYKTLQSGR